MATKITKVSKKLPVKDVIQWVSPSKIHPNNYNPNVMDPAKYEMLAEDINEQEVLDTPIVCICHPDIEGEYLIVDGEHRWRIAVAASMELVPITVKAWSTTEAKLHTIRRNILHGELDKGRFSTLMRNLQDETSLSPQDLRKRMGFATEKEFGRIHRVAKIDRTSMPQYEEEQEAQKKASKAVGLTSTIVRGVLDRYGLDAAEGVFVFTCAGKPVVSFSISKKTKPSFTQLVDLINNDLSVQDSQAVVHNIVEAIVEGLLENGS